MPTVQIELTPEQQTRLQEGATQQGLAVPDSLRALVITGLIRLPAIDNDQDKPRRSITELHGLGAEIWKDNNGQLLDAQQYVNELREE